MKSVLRIFSKIGIAVIAIFITLCIIEVFLNTVGTKYITIKKPRWINLQTNTIWGCFSLDPVTIYRPIPTEKYPHCTPTDNEGYRINPFASVHTKNNVIILLGDSFTWGYGTDDEQTYPSQLQRLLNNSGHEARVVNAGFPGFGTDQELVYFEHYILPNNKPSIVVWNIQENDWDDNNNACLYSVVDGQLRQHAGFMNTLFLLGNIYARTPKFLTKTKTYQYIFSLIPERKTPGCSQSKSDDIYNNHKITLEVEHMKRLSEAYHFRLIITFIQGQYSYESIQPPDYELRTAHKIDSIRSAQIEPVLVSQSIKNTLNGLAKDTLVSEVLGTSSADLNLRLFQENDPFPFGQKHMNELGNELFAIVVFQALSRIN